MALFFAKTIKDGSYQAHSIDLDGNLVYDPAKDERYSHFFNMKERYGLKFHKTDQKYNDQMSLYQTQIDIFNEEAIFQGDKLLTINDKIPRAYTNKEKESIITFTALAYGYYDHERTPIIKNLPMGILFGQFMTFWPAKIKYYFAPEGTKTKRGHFNHKHQIINGEKVYYYVKYVQDPDGSMHRVEVPESELTAEDPRAKAYE